MRRKKMNDIYPDRALAYQRFTAYLHKHIPIIRAREMHHALHRLIETDKVDFYVVFKKDFFKTFNDQFPEFILKYPEYSGVGESLNLTVLKQIVEREKETLLVYIYQNTKADKKAGKYVVYPKQFYNLAVANDLIREQDAVNSFKKADYSGKKEIVKEVTASIPVRHFLHNFDDWIAKEMFQESV